MMGINSTSNPAALQQQQQQLAAGGGNAEALRRAGSNQAGPGPSSLAMQHGAAGAAYRGTSAHAAQQVNAVARPGAAAAAGQGGAAAANKALTDAAAALLGAAAQSASRAASRLNTSLRCLCSIADPPKHLSPSVPPRVQCLGETCGVWQHPLCCHALAPPPAVARQLHDSFFCETCRISRADPFWEVIANDIVPPALVRPTGKEVLVSGLHMGARAVGPRQTHTYRQCCSDDPPAPIPLLTF